MLADGALEVGAAEGTDCCRVVVGPGVEGHQVEVQEGSEGERSFQILRKNAIEYL